ncbi:MAG: hypothetical protein COA79_12375 [Planctomycetota bacterium]|nr:MAG: hypothetical protein COA79_12375 [Planctomycetota bacterium]
MRSKINYCFIFILAELLISCTKISVQSPLDSCSKAIEKGTTYLIENQHPSGNWGSATRTKGLNIYAPIPGAHHGFKMASTALCLSALLKLDSKNKKVGQAIIKATHWIIKEIPKVKRATPDVIYNIWAHAYTIETLIQLHQYYKSLKIDSYQLKIEKLINHQIAMLYKYEVVDGGWAYYDFNIGSKKPAGSSSSFTTAATLISLKYAEKNGYKINQKIINRAIKALVRMQKPDKSYLYGEYLKWRPMHPVNRPPGSLGRTQSCNLALYLWSHESIQEQHLLTGTDKLARKHYWLDAGRKTVVPHESFFAIAGYFYYHALYYGSKNLSHLPNLHKKRLSETFIKYLCKRQEKNGSWWDFPLYNYHQFYGTGYALSALIDCRKAQINNP